jgi:hypothetical protein
MGERLPRDVRRFLDEHIDSVEQLDSLLLLRQERGRTLSAEDVSRRLRGSPASVQARLETLASHGLVEQTGDGYAYTRAGADDALVAELAGCYRTRRPAVIEAIFAGKPSAL